ncbi:hypothetical protein MTO96_041222 [Rhipicephalus appendiculatus]
MCLQSALRSKYATLVSRLVKDYPVSVMLMGYLSDYLKGLKYERAVREGMAGPELYFDLPALYVIVGTLSSAHRTRVIDCMELLYMLGTCAATRDNR